MFLSLQMELREDQSLHGAGAVIVQRWKRWGLTEIDSEIRSSISPV